MFPSGSTILVQETWDAHGWVAAVSRTIASVADSSKNVNVDSVQGPVRGACGSTVIPPSPGVSARGLTAARSFAESGRCAEAGSRLASGRRSSGVALLAKRGGLKGDHHGRLTATRSGAPAERAGGHRRGPSDRPALARCHAACVPSQSLTDDSSLACRAPAPAGRFKTAKD